MAEPKNPSLPKLREWPMFRAPASARRRTAHDGRAPPHLSELIMALVPGAPAEKLAWLRQQVASGRLDGDDPEELAQAEALLVMLARLPEPKVSKAEQHLNDWAGRGIEGDVSRE
jgi:hypothetical protein